MASWPAPQQLSFRTLVTPPLRSLLELASFLVAFSWKQKDIAIVPMHGVRLMSSVEGRLHHWAAPHHALPSLEEDDSRYAMWMLESSDTAQPL